MQSRRPLSLAAFAFILLILGCVSIKPSGDMRKHPPEEGEVIRLTGTVTAKEYKIFRDGRTPVLYLGDITEGQYGGSRTRQQKKEAVICYLAAGEELDTEDGLPRIGERVLLSGRVSHFREATNPGEFNLRQYYQILHISYRLNQTEILGSSGSYSKLKEKLYQIRRRCAEILEEIYPPEQAGVLKAMLLGEKNGLEEEIKELYQLAGLLHILSISGLHITLLGMAVYKLLKRCYVPVLFGAPAVIFLMWCYGSMTGMGVSTRRAVFMFSLHLAAEFFGRTYDMLTALSLAAVWMLAENPMLAYHSGFLLSFGAVAGIILVLPWVKTLAKERGNCQEDKGLWQGLQKGWNKWVREGMALGSAVALTTLPVVLWFYFRYPLCSLLLNLYVIPLMGIVLADGVLSVLAGFIWLEGARYVGLIDYFLLILYQYSCEAGLKLPGSNLIGGRPAIWQVILYYGILLFMVVWEEGCRSRKKRVSSLPRHCQKMLILAAVMLLFYRPVRGLTVSFLDVGQGDCIVLQNENGNCYLVDGGSTSKSEVGKYQMLPFLESRGIGELEAVFVTHPDEDHISGILELMRQSSYGVKVRSLILPDVAQQIKEAELSEIRKTAETYKIPVYYISRGDNITDKKLRIDCVGPGRGIESEEMNEISTVLYFRYGAFTMLLTGDVTGGAEQEMADYLEENRLAFPSLTILKAAHHGSRYSTPEEFLELTMPDYTVISAGKNNRYGHPHAELLERLEDVGSQVYSTMESGAVTIYTDGKKMRAETFLE